MKNNIFISPVSKENFEINFVKPVLEGIKLETIFQFVDIPKLLDCSCDSISIWGVKAYKMKYWENALENDILFFYNSGYLIYSATVFEKTINYKLAEKIWGVSQNAFLRQENSWPCLFFLKNLVKCQIPFDAIRRLANYQPNYFLRTFVSLSEESKNAYYNQYTTTENFIRNNSEISPIMVTVK